MSRCSVCPQCHKKTYSQRWGCKECNFIASIPEVPEEARYHPCAGGCGRGVKGTWCPDCYKKVYGKKGK